jgi:RNA polymerase sigma factor (sigma-70 family)
VQSGRDEYGGRVAGVLCAALGTLAEAQRSVVVLRLLEGLSFAEIGAQLGASEAACRVRFMRGLEQLRIEFEKEGLTP